MKESPRRLQHLLQRELDGELSRVEEAELSRLLWLHPEGRRERQGWQRLQQAIAQPDAPKLASARMAGAVVAGLAERPRAPSRRPWFWAFAVSTACAAAAGFLVIRTRPPAPEPPVYAAKKLRAPPVEVDLGGAELRPPREVEVRF